jgi:hypothetical protein
MKNQRKLELYKVNLQYSKGLFKKKPDINSGTKPRSY